MGFGLNGRIIAALIGINLFVAIVLSVALEQSKIRLESSVALTVENMVQLVDQNVTSATEKIDLSLQQIIENINHEMSKGASFDTLDLTPILDRHKAWIKDIADFRVTDSTGQLRYSSGQIGAAPVSYFDREYFPYLRDHPDAGLIVTDPLFGKLTNRWLIIFVRRFNLPNGDFGGVVIAAVQINYFGDLISRLDLGKQGVALLRDSTGGMIVRSPPSPLPNQQIGGRGYSKELADIMASNTRSAIFHPRMTGDGNERINAYRRLKAVPFHAVVGLGTNEYLAPWYTEVHKAVGLFITFLLITSGMTAILIRVIRQHDAARQSADTLIEHASDGVHILESDGHLLTASRSFYRMLGYDPDHPPDLQASDWEAQWTPMELLGHMRRLMTDSRTFRTKHRRRDGTVFDVEIHARGITLDGRPVIYASSRDIGERMKFETALQDSQELVSALMNASNDASLLLDDQGIVLAANAELARRFNRQIDELIGERFFDLLPPAIADQRRRYCKSAIESGLPQQLLDERGGLILDNRIYPVASSDGKFRRVAVHSRDITEQYRSEQRILQLLGRQTAILANSPVGIAILDLERRFQEVNPAFCEIFGWSPDDILGKSARLLHGTDESYHELGSHYLPIIQQGDVFRDDVLMNRADGSEVWVRLVSRLIDGRDRSMGIICGFEDISSRKQMEQTLQRTNAELEQFAYVASHDLRQPLRMITSYLGLIKKELSETFNDQQTQYFNFAMDGATRMDRLILDLLEYSRTGRSRQPEPIDLNRVIADALANLRTAVDETSAEIIVAHDFPTVVGDMVELTRLFQNLVGNALKYRSPDRPARVEITHFRQGSDLVFAVIDNGIGIAPQDHERAFSIFQRLVPRDAYEGTGIGLAICRKIVDHHKGRIWIESEVGVGSRFLFTLGNSSASA